MARSLGIEQTLNFMQDSDEKKRKAAAQALAKTFKNNLRQFTLITNTLAKDKEISDRWRGFEDVAAARHLSNRVEPEVVEALVEAVRDAYPRLSHRYYALKAKWFGRKKLAHWDRNAPLPKVAQRTIPWSDARETVITAYARVLAEAGRDRRALFPAQLDRCAGARRQAARRLRASDRAVGASLCAAQLPGQAARRDDARARARPWRASGAGCAERRADGADAADACGDRDVFGEMLTFRKLLADTTDKKQRKSMLAAKVEDMINTVVRQIAFYSFERKVHTERRNGELTVGQLNELWMSVQDESLGPAIELKPGYETFWAYIPHFVHSPFYVYAYAFGDCLVNSLYAVYEQSAEGFAERYLEMLAAGGTKHHSELLRPFGLDAKRPEFLGRAA